MTVVRAEPYSQMTPLLPTLRQVTMLFEVLLQEFSLLIVLWHFAPELIQAVRREFKHSNWASPLHMVPKAQDGEWRACGDYNDLSAMIRLDRYPIPYMLDFHIKLHGKATS